MKIRHTLYCSPLLLTPVFSAQAGECDNAAVPATTPGSDFEVLGDGSTVRHEPTGRVWARCSLGQEWNAATESCDGTAEDFHWRDALQEVAEINADGGFAGHSDWRVPNINELESIVERCKHAPAINEEIFPDSSTYFYWSSTPSVALSNDNTRAWQINFQDGGVSMAGRASDTFYENLVRIVRDTDGQ